MRKTCNSQPGFLSVLSGSMEQTPDQKLLEAAENGSVDDILACLGEGASPNAARGDKFSALHMAACRNAPDIVQTLLDHGGDPNVYDIDFSTPLYLAAGDGFSEVVKTLLAGKANPIATTLDNETPLHIAAAKGHTDTIKALLAGGALVNMMDSDRENPLFKAVMGKKPAAVSLLLGNGALSSIRNAYGNTPLLLANNTEIVRILLEHGVSPDDADEGKNTPLYLAMDKRNLEIAELLIEYGADIRAENIHGSTPLITWPELENIKARIDAAKTRHPLADHHARMRAFAAHLPSAPRL